MTERSPAADRRRQIVEAACELLADVPLERLTTRQIAKHLGLSQPALFRHFRSRDGILLAVVDHARADLAEVVGELDRTRSALEVLLALARALLIHVEARPGLPRLLFALSAPSEGPVSAALAGLVAARRSLVAELIRQGQAEGQVDPAWAAAELAEHFLALLRGLILGWQSSGRPVGLSDRAEGMVSLFVRGAGARDGASLPLPAPPVRRPEEVGGPGPPPRLARLDVRPVLAGGEEPLEQVLSAVDGLGPGSVLVIEAPFRPTPLLSLLARRGHGVHSEELSPGHWVALVALGGPTIEDLRDLEAPEPLERVLLATAAMPPGSSYLAHTPRIPGLALQRLGERSLKAETLELPDASALLLVRAPRSK